tara:strand:- start:1229 stop:2224 length:996 start_codon:yes stop_codon:yes gene_type:complete
MVRPKIMAMHPSNLEIRRIVTDSDLDGVVTAAILGRWWTDAEVVFGHPGELRAGLFDDLIDEWTAVCDLPMHPKCGLSIDHHQSNRPGDNESRAIVVWKDAPSAARIAYELFHEVIDLSDLEDLLVWVDKLDSGSISHEEFLSHAPAVWLSRIVDSGEEATAWVLEQLKSGVTIEEILADSRISKLVTEKEEELENLNEIILSSMRIQDRIAVVRLDGSGIRSNGYHVTAMAGDRCDACMIIHGDIGADFGDSGKYPVSASFYTNSFLHRRGGIYDLTALATLLDSNGGGHANACGCRIQPIEGGDVVDRDVSEDDIERNISEWLKMWSKR